MTMPRGEDLKFLLKGDVRLLSQTAPTTIKVLANQNSALFSKPFFAKKDKSENPSESRDNEYDIVTLMLCCICEK